MKQYLVMKYHPAKKEVEFRRFSNGKEVAIRKDSGLQSYMEREKGKFVLQNCGNQFFDTIARAFDGMKMVDIRVITTEIDFNDFKEMAEYYNEDPGHNCKMSVSLQAQLPNMSETCKDVERYGTEAIKILAKHRELLEHKFTSKDGTETLQEKNKFSEALNKAIQDLQEKIRSLSDNRVNLCLVGGYSAGKSALINAIVGSKILPEAIKSETAKMFRISSPAQNEAVRICFDIFQTSTELQWKEEAKSFEFIAAPSEDGTRREIQELLYTLRKREESKQRQIRQILDHLNSRPEISSKVDIYYPIPLDNERVQFTIYDTPGTDSNHQKEHEGILNAALEHQEQSILIFVIKSDSLEGEANSLLLNYLQELKQNSGKAGIDLDRSLFVINKADAVAKDARQSLQKAVLQHKNDSSIQLPLAEKKLFFTSAQYAYVAKAIMTGTERDDAMLMAGKTVMATENIPFSFCYRENRCAGSDYLTSKIIENCDLACAKAIENNDDVLLLWICSGLYALEQDVLQFGEKYAFTVKAYTIIETVERTLRDLSGRTGTIRENSEKKAQDIQREIDELRNTIEQTLKDLQEKYMFSSGELPKATQKKLQIDSSSIESKLISPIKEELKEKLEGKRFHEDELKSSDEDNRRNAEIVSQTIASVYQEYSKHYKDARQELLVTRSQCFLDELKRKISVNKNISDVAKRIFQGIQAPTVPDIQIYDLYNLLDLSRKEIRTFLFFKRQVIMKTEVIKSVELELVGETRDMQTKYIDEYCNTINALLNGISSEFYSHLDDYSAQMAALKQNKEAMLKLADHISATEKELESCQKNLDKLIWRENNDD